jgi:hypothetical protein
MALPVGTGTFKGQAAYYYSRRRRKGLYDPASQLFITHRYTTSDTNIATATVFPGTVRAAPVTFAFDLIRTGAANGIVFEFGSTTRGVAVWLNGNDLGVAAGTGTAAPTNGVTLNLTGALPATGARFRFVLAITPGNGRVELWRNGTLVAQGTASAGSFGGDWADTDNGAVGAVQGTVNDRVPAGQRVALANTTIVGPLEVYARQRAGA